MNITFKTLAAMCAVMFGMTGCSTTDGNSSSSDDVSQVIDGNDSVQLSIDGIVPDKEEDIVKKATCKIAFSDEEIKIDGSGAAVENNVVTISGAGVYSLSGKSSDAKILIKAENKDVKLLFNGVELTSKSGSVIDCQKAQLLTLCIAGNTKNVVTDSTNYTFEAGEDEPDAAIFSRSNTVVSGSGELEVNGIYKDAIKCKDGFTVGGGTLVLNASQDAVTGKDYAVIYGGDVSIVCGGDGIKSTNSVDEGLGYVTITDGTIEIDSQKDGIQAQTQLTVSGGDIKIRAGGDAADADIVYEEESYDRFNRGVQTSLQTASDGTDDSVSCKGMKAGSNISITGGLFDIVSADDSIHANASITIENGEFTLSSCDDAIHADDNLTVSGGVIDIVKSNEGLEGKSIDILDGKINIKSVDDGLNASDGDSALYSSSKECYISISGGEIVVDVESGDGLDSNGTIAQTGGSLTVFGPVNNNNSAIDYESSYALSGGYLVAVGPSGMAQAPSTLSQPCISIYANVQAGSMVEVRDNSGEAIISVTVPKSCRSLIFSCDEMKQGLEYSIYSDNALISTVTTTDGVSGGGASGNGFAGGRGSFNRGDFAGTNSDGMTPADGGFRPTRTWAAAENA